MTFPIPPEAKVGHVSDDLAMSFEWSDVSDRRPRWQVPAPVRLERPNKRPNNSGFEGTISDSNPSLLIHPNSLPMKMAEREGFEPPPA